MLKKIKNLLKTGEICGIFTNTENTSKYTVGYITACDKEYVILQSMDRYGYYDGFYCLQIQNIFKIETKTVYIKNIEKLYKYGNPTERISLISQESLLLNFINFIYENKRTCEIELCGNSQYEDAAGFIESIDGDGNTITIENISNDGIKDGNYVIDITKISCITYESLDDVKRETLFKLNSAQT